MLGREAPAALEVDVTRDPADGGGDAVELVEGEIEVGADREQAQVVGQGEDPAGEEQAEEGEL
jgi:hypothetical protein